MSDRFSLFIGSQTIPESTASTFSATRLATALLALTTPFVPPYRSCSAIWSQTTFDTYDSNGIHVRATADISDTSNPEFTSCMPSDWASIVPASRFSFSPAVCPEKWTYYSMASTVSMMTDSTSYSYSTFSTAYCCASGYNLEEERMGFRIGNALPCIHTVEPDSKFQMHPAWHIAWTDSDTSTMTPALPALTSQKLIPSWEPGQVIPRGKYDRDDREEAKDWGKVVKFLMIGLPIILVVCISACCWCCIAGRKSRRQRQKELSDGAETGMGKNELPAGSSPVAVEFRQLNPLDVGLGAAELSEKNKPAELKATSDEPVELNAMPRN